MFDDHNAITPVGNPIGVPIPVAFVVVCVIGVSEVFLQSVGDEDAALTVSVEFVTIIVPVAFTVPQPPVKGIE